MIWEIISRYCQYLRMISGGMSGVLFRRHKSAVPGLDQGHNLARFVPPICFGDAFQHHEFGWRKFEVKLLHTRWATRFFLMTFQPGMRVASL